jgi:hypothetical protein
LSDFGLLADPALDPDLDWGREGVDMVEVKARRASQNFWFRRFKGIEM